MSKIADIYDAMNTRIAALLTTHTRLLNPYKVDENPSPFLKAGYGVALGSAENSKRMIYPKLSMRRVMTVVLTRKFYATEANVTAKASAEKQLLEDQLLVIKDFEANGALNATAFKTEFVSDGGIEYVSTDTDQFITTQTVFSVEYLEDLTA